MDSLRKRNFFIDIRGIRKLRDENIYNFIAKNLELTPLDVAAIQIDRIEGKVFVEMKTQEAVQEVVEEFDNKYVMDNNGTTHRIRLYVEDGGTDVKLHHLPPNMPEEWIIEYLANYGDIISIKHEMCQSKFFSQTLSGIRIVRIRMTSPIPSFVNIKGYSSHVTYTNQIQTCRHCNQEVHFGVSCSENRAKTKSSLYSRVLAQTGGPVEPGEQPAPVTLATTPLAPAPLAPVALAPSPLSPKPSPSPQSSTQRQPSSQSQTAQQQFKRPASPFEAALREKTVKTSSADTGATTAAATENSKSTDISKGHEGMSAVSDRLRITPTNSRSNSLTRKPEKPMEISDDETPESYNTRSRRSSKSKHEGK